VFAPVVIAVVVAVMVAVMVDVVVVVVAAAFPHAGVWSAVVAVAAVDVEVVGPGVIVVVVFCGARFPSFWRLSFLLRCDQAMRLKGCFCRCRGRGRCCGCSRVCCCSKWLSPTVTYGLLLHLLRGLWTMSRRCCCGTYLNSFCSCCCCGLLCGGCFPSHWCLDSVAVGLGMATCVAVFVAAVVVVTAEVAAVDVVVVLLSCGGVVFLLVWLSFFAVELVFVVVAVVSAIARVGATAALMISDNHFRRHGVITSGHWGG
jgi:hypothetical protein